jgi:hypothetical protein
MKGAAMSLRLSIVWITEHGDVELASTIDPRVLRAAKAAVLRTAEHKAAANVGYGEVRELRARLEYQRLKELLDYVLPEVNDRGLRRRRDRCLSCQEAKEVGDDVR